MSTVRLPRSASAALGVVAIIGAWALLSVTVLSASSGVPTPWAVVHGLFTDGWGFYRPHLEQTCSEAAKGYAIGTALAVAAAVLVLVLPPLERVVMQLAVASYCLPLVAIGPILSILFDGDKPMVTLAALAVFFTTLVGALLGLRSADRTSLDLVRAYGGGSWAAVRKVRLVAALPSLLAALQIAAPAALLGAIIGEYLGHVDVGLGLAMIVSEQQLEVARTWDIALVAGAVACLAYGSVALVARVVLPWNRSTTMGSTR